MSRLTVAESPPADGAPRPTSVVSMHATPAPIVFVDDDSSFRRIMSRELERLGFAVRSFESAEGVREHVSESQPRAVLLDLAMPGVGGLELLDGLLADDPKLQVVVLTGHGSVTEAVQAMRRGALDFLTKPVSLDVLEQTLRKAVATAELIAENRRLRRVATSGKVAPLDLPSPESARLRSDVERVARADKSVLIQGESGVGKELVARMLHSESPRSEGPFVPVNCAAIPGQLVESELFGHRRGAFTGADAARIGLFEAASGGTLFLDEIGELPLEVQPKLLRALPFGEIRALGTETARIVDVRVVGATHRDLRALVAEGAFREDLFYRLAILELEVPALRQRRSDIPVLARHFLARESARAERPLRLTPAAEKWLTAREWPGNGRELENAMVRVSVLATREEVDEGDLARILTVARTERDSGALPTLELRELERLAIEQAMQRHGGNKRSAAQELGIALKTLYNKLGRAGEA